MPSHVQMSGVAPLLTRRQTRIIGFVRDYWVTCDTAPTLAEIAVACGLAPTCTRTVVDDLFALQRAGWIRQAPGKARAIEVLDPDTGRAA